MLTIEESAKLLNVSEHSIRRYIDNKQLKATQNRLKKGRPWEIDRNDLKTFADSMKVKNV